MTIKCLAFDCFGTVFDMEGVSRDEIAAYVAHVRLADFSPYRFSEPWWNINPHPDSAPGVRMLRENGFTCVTLSNGAASMLGYLAKKNDIPFHQIIDLTKHKAYKPKNLDAYRAVEKETGFKPNETMMVTANPTFGDVEGASAIGMIPQVIRQPDRPQTILELAQGLGVAS
jgi:2-haloalkanoic acid dehalogenase type II